MSNPGVLYLATKRLSNGSGIRIEDNIGESIHIHYGNELRIDLTISELLDLEEVANNSLNNLLSSTGFDTKYFDPVFLDMFSEKLIDLLEVKFEKIRLSQLLILTKNLFGLPVIRPIGYSRVAKALKGNKKELENYCQENFHGQSNTDRLTAMYESIKKEGYPYNDKYIVLFNNQNVIRDGQHRAACLFHLAGDQEVTIIRMFFKNNCTNTSLHPWIAYLFRWDKRKIKKVCKLFIKDLRRLFSKIHNFFTLLFK